MKKYNTYTVKMYENDDFEFVNQLYINGVLVLSEATDEDIEMKIMEWEWKNEDKLYTEARAAEKAKDTGMTAKEYESLQTEGYGYGEDVDDIPAWR